MSLYLYLNEHWHADSWVNGGPIPINPASTYKSLERSGIFTPDENLIHKSEVDLFSLSPIFEFSDGGVRGLSVIDCTQYGDPLPNIYKADLCEDDGLILSFSSRLSRIVARKMGKKACVKIIDIQVLKCAIDEQLGVSSESDYCQYTSGHERNHFLKSELDSWQAEFRLFWPIAKKVEVVLPPGIAELICSW